MLAEMLRALGRAVVVVLFTAAAYEVALALGAGSVGPDPGEGVEGEGVVQAVALLAILAGAALGVVYAARPRAVAALLAPAAATFLVAFFFTYDPYYAPTRRRFSDDGAVPFRWIALVAAAALAAGVLARMRPRLGSLVTTGVLVVLLLTTLFVGDGH
jgi:hypothetical protein